LINSKDIELQELMYRRKKYGLGAIFKAKYLIHDIACRVIKFERLTRYEMESLSNDILNLT